MSEKLCGCILAGGNSSRMGQNKALLAANHGSQNLLQHAWNLLTRVVDHCFVSCAPGRGYDGYPCIADTFSGIGPAAGILTALQTADQLGRAAVFILACDLPLMTVPLLKNIVDIHFAAKKAPLATLYRDGAAGKVEMLAGIYSVHAIPAITAAIQAGRYSIYHMLAGNIREITYPPEQKHFFLNCNTPDDLQRLKTMNLSLPD